MELNFIQRAIFRFYELGWNLVIPLSKFNRRIAEGYDQRKFTQLPDEPARLWVQAASAGEAYLTWELIKRLHPYEPINVFLTSNTKQGIEILNRAVDDITPNNRGVSAISAYFPFDKPSIMRRAVDYIRPHVMVLLETELWPGLLGTLKEYGCKCIIINGRISEKSFHRYRYLSLIWPSIRPDAIMAISKEDARRYAVLFNHNHVTTMPNMKFDRLVPSKTSENSENPLSKIIPPDTPFIVFGSIRKKEEPAVAKMMKSILNEIPQSVFGVFPRHLNRIRHWETLLKRRSIPCQLRSSLKSPATPGSVILWDVFGELTTAYIKAKAAFVGGTLAPLGGQNFLEAMICGVPPVIGPHWDNFKWIGSEIIEHGFVRQASNQRQVAEILIRDIQEGYDRTTFHEKALTYIKNRQGGSDRASNVICEYLKR